MKKVTMGAGTKTSTDSRLTFLAGDASVAARRLLGSQLVRTLDDVEIRATIVETESYDQTDAASHSYRGKTPRTDVMFGEPGHLYVYFTYGMHYCCNVVTGAAGEGSAVLIRAVEPISGSEIVEQYRGIKGVGATNGPAKLCQALRIDAALNGHDLQYSPLRLEMLSPINDQDIVTTTRIGISRAREELRRFYIRDNPYVSKSRMTLNERKLP